MRKKLISLISLWMVLFLLAGQSVLAAAPRVDASITEENIFALLDAYDKDGAYILRTMSQKGDSILSWWQGCNLIVDGVNTGVHEEFHGYSFLNLAQNVENIYIGNQKHIGVRMTKVFPTKIMSTTIPSNLRTLRWSTYVGNPIPNLGSNDLGIYGLFNEFTAYYWGMHAQMSLYDYYKSNHASTEYWQQFISMCANDRLAYAEFKYYMLQYLVYAKEHYRSVYNEIIGNKSFVLAYQVIEKQFAALIAKFEKRMQDIRTLLEKDGYSVEIDEYYYIGGYGTGIFQRDYDSLMNQLKKPVYGNILGNSAASSDKTSLGTTSITSLSKVKKGVKLKWKKASGAKGYYVYRKKAGEKKYKKVKTISGTSWTDKSVKKGKKYSYKIIPYAKTGTTITKGKFSAAKSLRI